MYINILKIGQISAKTQKKPIMHEQENVYKLYTEPKKKLSQSMSQLLKGTT